MSEFKKPKAYIVCKTVAFVLLAIAAVFFVGGLVHEIMNPDHSNNGTIVIVRIGVGFAILSIIMFIIAFGPERRRMLAKYARYRQNETKDIATDIYLTQAEIKSGGIKTIAKAFKDGMKDSIFCKHCGAEIDQDSKFCRECGKEQ